MPIAAVAIPALIGAGGSIASGIIGRSAAKKAAGQQFDVAQGIAADAYKKASEAQGYVQGAAKEASTGVQQAAGQAASGFQQATGQGIQTVNDATAAANAKLQGAYDQFAPQLAPYQSLGSSSAQSLQSELAAGGKLNTPFTAENFQQLDPGYAFRLAEGQKALQQSGAAQGALQSGGMLKALTNYAQNYASGEFGNAFNRYMAQNQQRYNELLGTANLGMGANQQQLSALNAFTQPQASNLMNAGYFGGQAGINAGKYSGDLTMQAGLYSGDANRQAALAAGQFGLQGSQMAGSALTGGANAQAAGTIGGANATAGMIGGITGGIGDAFRNYQIYDLYRRLGAGSGTLVGTGGLTPPQIGVDETGAVGMP